MKKQVSTKKPITRKAAANNDIPRTQQRAKFNPWSLSIYFYWFIILFFIAATFYILGRSHGVLNNRVADNVEITEEALRTQSDYYENARQKLMAGNVDDALADLNAAIADGNAATAFYILRGEAYMLSGNYSAATSDLDYAVSKDPSNAMAYYDRALLHARMEDYQAALNDINNTMVAMSENPNEMLQLRDLYAKRGQLNLWLKNWDGAIADYTNSLARPEGTVNPSVYAERAEAYTATGNLTAAVDDYASAVRIISEQIQAITSADERESLSARAMSYFEKSAALNLNLGKMDAAATDLDAARTIAVALNDSDSVSRIEGLMYSLSSQTQETNQ